MLLFKRYFIAAAAVLFSLSFAAFAQTPTPTPPDAAVEKISTEEIKLGVLAFDESNNFAENLRVEDVVIMEDGRLHQPTSLRRIPANVLLVLDVGGEIAYAKRNKATAEAARSLVAALQPADAVAALQYGDRVEILTDWTTDKTRAAQALSERKLGFGKRSAFVSALDKAVGFFDRTPRENRHLVLITDGVDSYEDEAARASATRKLLSSDINVHVISYTKLQQNAIGSTKSAKLGTGGNRVPALPPGAGPPHSNPNQTFPIGSINLDREMLRKRREQVAQLKTAEAYLAAIAEDTNGEIFLPETTDEMTEKTSVLAKNIDSQYVVTYTPKRPLSEAKDGEVRLIEVSSRRAGVSVQGRRRFIVSNNQ